MYEFNLFIKSSKATMLNISGAPSHQFLHYLEVILDSNFLDKHTQHPFVKIRKKIILKKPVYNNYKKTD